MEEKTSITMDVFFEQLSELLATLKKKETPNIEKAAKIVADSIANDGVVHVFGSGHSYGFGVEISNRPGSLVPIHSIKSSEFVLQGKYTLQDFKNPDNIFERRPGIADQLYDLYDVRPQDCFIIISNSGINGLVIDMAIKAKQEKHPVIVVTSWQHTSAEASRHPSGKKLYEMGDVVIDNCGPRGDALIETPGPEKICSVSSITGSFIAQAIALDAMEILKEEGKDIPMFYGNETPEDAAHDKALLDHYQGRI
jgi:uncharacterized phosphosugar-binding protein